MAGDFSVDAIVVQRADASVGYSREGVVSSIVRLDIISQAPRRLILS